MKQLNLDIQIPHPPHATIPPAFAEEPPQRLESCGAAARSDRELLALVRQPGLRADESLALARTLIAEAGSIAALSTWLAGDFRRVPGVGRGKGTTVGRDQRESPAGSWRDPRKSRR
jgi:DNA repair protein RadC